MLGAPPRRLAAGGARSPRLAAGTARPLPALGAAMEKEAPISAPPPVAPPCQGDDSRSSIFGMPRISSDFQGFY